MRAQVNFPGTQIVNAVSTGPLSTTPTTVAIAPTTSGQRPTWVRIAISAGAAHVRMVSSTAGTTITSDSVVTSSEALWLSTLGLTAVAARQTLGSAGTAGAQVNVGSIEEGVIGSSPTSIG